MAERFPAQQSYLDKSGVARLKLEDLATFEVMCSVLLNPLIDYGLDSPLIVCQLLFSLGRVAAKLCSADQASILFTFIERINAVSQEAVKDDKEKEMIQQEVANLKWSLTQRLSIAA